MLDWLSVLFSYGSPQVSSLSSVGTLSVFFRLRAGPNLWVLPFYLIWMLPIFLGIWFVAAIWWVWEKLFKSGGK
jgi:hypothetical protein